MKNHTRINKLLTVLLLLCVLFVCMAGAAMAEDCAHTFTDGQCSTCGVMGGYCGAETNEGGAESVWWTLTDSNSVLTITGTGAMADYTSSVRPWADYCDSITTLVIKDGVTIIGASAFDGCTGLTSVKIPNSVTIIGYAAFGYCTGLTSIEIPSSVTTIGEFAFDRCIGLVSIEIPNSVTTIGNWAFDSCTGLKSVTIPSSVTEIGVDPFLGCTNVSTVIISCTPSDAVYGCIYPNLERAELIEEHAYANGVCTDCGEHCPGHTGGEATCTEKAVCTICGASYGELGAHTAEPTYVPNAGDSTQHDATYSCCGATVTEAHTMNVTTGKCVCGADMTAIATVTDGTNTYYAADAATLNQAVTAILETGSRTFTVELPADASAEMIIAIRRAICDTEGVADGSIHLTLKGVTTIPGTTNWDGVAFGPGDIYDEAGKIVDQELVTQLASINLPDVTEIGAQAFYFCENLVSVSAPKAQTIGAQAFGYTALTSVEFPELTTIPTDMFSGTWTLSSAKFPKVTTIEQGGLLVGAKFMPENNPTPFPLELTAEGDITFNGSNHFNIKSQNYSGKVDLVLCCDKADKVTKNEDGTATWQVRDDLSYTFKSITFKHSYVDGKCTACGEDCTHTGGTATCTTLAVCDTCGASYGEVGGHSPNAAGYTVNADGTHSYTCSSCGNPFTESHTFTDGACTGCGVIGGYCGEEGNEQNVIWTYANGTLTVSGTGAMADQFDNYDNRPWEAYVDQITTIVVNDGITSIGEAAFWSFQQLTTAKLPDSLTTISQQAFYGCTALKTVNFPANLKTIEGWAFLGCALESVTLPEGLTTIGYRAFSECKNLTSVTVPASVTTIDEGAFGYSPAKITVAEDNLNYSSDEHGVLFDKDKTTLIYCRPNIEVETYTIPSTVTEICKEAFYGCKNLATITIPDGVQKIGSSAFGSCEALTTITIPAGVTTIEANTFYDCTALTAVTIPAGVTTIDMWAFSGCTALTTVTIPASVTSIAYNAFSNCSALTTVNVPCTWDGSLYTFDEGVTVNKVHNWVGGTCTVCGVSCDHTDSTHTAVTDKGDGTHSFECSVCGETGSEAHNYKTGTSAGACACGAACPHSNFDSATGNCTDCETSLAIAKIKTGETTIYYQTAYELSTAIENNSADQAITLLANFEVIRDLCFYAGEAKNTLDLNGHALTGSSRIDVASGELTITGPGSINIFMTADNEGAKIVVGSGVTLNDTLRSVYGGILDLTGATIPEAGLNVILYSDDYMPATYNVSDVLLLPEDYYFFVDGKAVYTYSVETEGTVLKHTDHSYTYTDNGDGTHKATCTACGKVEVDNEPHTIENHVCTACGAMEIVVSFNAGDYEWKTGDTLYFCRVSRENEWEEYCFTATVAEDGTVTWTPDKTLYWDDTGKHKLVVVYPGDTPWAWDRFYVGDDQTTTEKLHEFDLMNAMWSGNPTTDPIPLNLKHRLAKVTVNYEIAEGVTVSKAEVYTLTQYLLFDIHTLERKNIAWEEGHDLWINSYHNGNQFTAFVSPDAYAADGNFIKITLSDGSVREVKMNKAVTFEEGKEYTYKLIITADGAYLTCEDECSFEYTDNGNGTHKKVCSECGYVAASENHTLTYTTNGSTITVSCSANCGHTGTATISATGKTYDGTAVEVIVSKTGSLEKTDIPVTLTKDGEAFAGEPVNAGAYTASITLGDKTVSVDFTIAKADAIITLAPTPNTLTYIGEAQYLINTGEAVGGTMLYSLTEDGEYTTTIPQGTNAGDYTVWYYVRGEANHSDSAKDSVDVTIAKAEPRAEDFIFQAPGDLTYNGETKSASVSVQDGSVGMGDIIAVMYYNGDSNIAVEKQPISAGNYFVQINVDEGENYTARSFFGGEDWVFTIAPMQIYIDPDFGATLADVVYNESGVYTLTVTGVAFKSVGAGNTVPLTLGTDYTATATQTDVSYGELIKAVTATVDVTLKNGNYQLNTNVCTATANIVEHEHDWKYTANGATITATCANTDGHCPDAEQSITISAVGKTYDGTPVTATLTGSIDGVATPEIIYTGNTNAGTHTASITVGEVTASVDFTIAKATVTVTADAKSKPYGTDNPTLTYTSEGLLGDDVLTGALETTATKTSNVGEYDITVGSLANSNYTIVFVGAKLTITKADSSCTAPVAVSGLTFNGGNQSLITAGTATGGTMQYSLDNVTWSETIPTGKDAKTYTVYYKVVGDGNHIDTDPISLDVTITPKAVTELTFEGLNEVYAHTGEAIIPTFVVTDGETTLTEGTDYTADITNNTDVGTATITITLTGNYSGTVTKTFEIKTHVHEWNYSASGDTITATCTSTIGTCSDAEQSITLNAPDAVYSGNPVEAEVTSDGADLTYNLRYTGTNYDSANAPANVGDYTVTMTVGDKSVSDTFTISPKDISVVQSVQFSLAQTSFVYSGEAPELAVNAVDSSVGNYTMQENTDYKVGTVQVNAGSYKLTVTGMGNYTGSVELDYSIAAKPITITDAVVENVTFDPAGYTLTVKEVVFDGVIEGENLVMGENGDYAAVAELTSENAASDAATANVTVSLMNANYSLSETTVEATFQITQSGTEMTATADKTSYTYGETITVTGTVKATGTAPATTLALRSAPAAQQVALFAADGTQLTDPVNVVDGAYTLTYNTADKGILPAEAITLTVKFVGDEDMADAAVNVSIALTEKQLTATEATATTRAYESDNATVSVTAVTISGVIGADDVKVDTTNLTGEISSSDAGTYTSVKLADLTLIGNDKAFYTISDAAVPTSVEITPKEITNPTIVLDASSFVYDGTEKKPAVTAVKDGDDLIDAAEYTVSYANNIEMGTATVTLTDVAGGNYTVSGSTTFQITQSGTAMTAKADKTSYTYGETITVTGTVKATGTAPATTLTLRSAPAAQQVALFAADGTQLTDPVNVVDGAYTLTYNTADKGILPAVSITLTVKFVGDEDMADAAANVSIALTEKQLTATEATATTRAYEPNNTTVSVTAVAISGVIGTDDVKVDATNLTGEISSSDAGTYTSVKLADLTLIGNDKEFYTISDATVTTSVEITPKEITNPTIVLDASSFVYDGTEKKPAVTSVKDGDDLIDATEYTVSYANNIEMGTATVTLTDAAGGNYTVSGSTTFQITQSGTEMTATADKTSYTYGETITVTGTVKATGTSPAATLTLRSAPAAQQVALFAADGTQLTDPVNVVDGAYTLTYNTADKGILPAASITLKVKFVGDGNMADQSAAVTVALTAKSIEPVLSGSASKAYDGTTTVTDASNLTISLNGVIAGDNVSAAAAGYVYADETVGQSKTVTANGITLSGADSIFYTLAQTEASAQIGEIKKAMLIGLTEPADTTLDVYCADADAVIGKLPDTVVYHLADGKTVDLKVEWSCTAYDSTPGATNTFAWAVSDSEKLACYEIAQNVADDGTIIVTNSEFLPVTVTGTDTAITYNGTAYDVTQMFAIDSNAGAAVFEIIGGGTGEGTLNGSVLTITKAGTFNIKVTTAPNAAYAAGEATAVLTISKGTPAVTLPTGLTAWYGQKLSDIALPAVDGGAWSWTDMNSTVGNAGVQTHQAIFTPADTNLWNITTHPVNITVAQAGTSFGEMKVYNGNAETTTFTYGETITVKAEATAVQPAAFSLRSLIAPAKHQMALFIRNADGSEVQISEAVNEQNGVYTMTYNTTGKALSIGDNALIAKFVGDENMADYQETVLVTLNPKELGIASLTAQDRVYEPGNQQVAITGTEVSGKADENDDVSVLIDGMTATISSENVGTYDTALIPQDVSLTGNHAGYYFARGNVAVSIPQGVEITQATPYTTSGAHAQPVFDPIYQDGQTLGDIPVSLPAGTFNVPGIIEWEAPGDTPVTEGTPFTWVFTPDDPNWKPVTGTVVIYPDGEPPVITAPAGDQAVTVYEGEQGTMFITAADASSYQWYINRYDGLGYVPISGATSASYTTSVVNLGNDGFTYYCVASNAYGDTESPVFLLQVLEKIEVPETGDESNIALWTALAILSFAGLTIITMNGRRSKITR